MRRTMCLMVFACGLSAGAVAARPARAQDAGVAFNLEDASLDTVVRFLSEQIGVQVTVDDEAKGKLAGKKLTAVSARPMPARQAVDFLNSVLAPHGVAAVRVKDVVKLMTVEKARKETFIIEVGADPERVPFGDEVMTQVIPLKYATAEQLKKELGDMTSTSGQLLFNERSNVLVLTDTATNVRRFVSIIKAIDQQVYGGIKVTTFKLVNADCEDVAKVIREVFAPPGAGQQQNRGRGGGMQEMIRMFTGGGQNDNKPKSSPLGEVKVSTEARSNSVIVSAAEDYMEEITRVVKDLDSVKVPLPVTRVFSLKNADATNVAAILTDLFRTQAPRTGTGGAAGRTQAGTQNQNPFARFFGGQGGGAQGGGAQGGGGAPRGGGAQGAGGQGGGRRSDREGFGAVVPGFAAPAMVQDDGGTPIPIPFPTGAEGGAEGGAGAGAAQGVSGEVRVRADTDSNSVIVVTDPTNVDAIQRVVDTLDAARRQVLIKCFIAEVTLDDDSSLGVEWRWSDDLHVRKDPGSGSAKSNFDLTAPSRAVGFQYQLLSENIDLFVNGLKRTGKLKVLSAPRILALDNEQAEINVGRRVPFIRNTRTTQDGQTLNTVEYEDIGIILTVTPHVNPDNRVRIELAPEVSEVAPESEAITITEGVTSPVFVTTSATTTVTVNSDQTVVIGGLIRDRWSKSQSKVPFLGDIPLIGPLFTSDTHEKTRTELMIFITPIVLGVEDLKRVTEDEVKALKVLNWTWFDQGVMRDGHPTAAQIAEKTPTAVGPKKTADLDE